MGQTVLYFCNEGYELLGSNTRLCLRDGRLSGSKPLCRPGKQIFNNLLNVMLLGF